MSDTRLIGALTVDEFKAMFYPDHSDSFVYAGTAVTDTPAVVVTTPVQYKWACQLIGLPVEVRRLYGTDDEITAAWEVEKWDGYPDSLRRKFYVKL